MSSRQQTAPLRQITPYKKPKPACAERRSSRFWSETVDQKTRSSISSREIKRQEVLCLCSYSTSVYMRLTACGHVCGPMFEYSIQQQLANCFCVGWALLLLFISAVLTLWLLWMYYMFYRPYLNLSRENKKSLMISLWFTRYGLMAVAVVQLAVIYCHRILSLITPLTNQVQQPIYALILCIVYIYTYLHPS